MQSLIRNAKWAGLSVLLMSGAAYASFDPVFTGTSPSAPNTSFNYALVFGTAGTPSTERLEPGDFVTIYDITGLVNATAPAGFSVSTQNSGINGFGTSPTDSAALPNATFTYTGSTVSTDTTFTGFSIVSTVPDTTIGQFTSEDTSNNTGTSGQPVGHIGPVTIPGGGIPEPSSVLSLGAFGMLAVLRRRK
jgi:hypothetical protein